MLIRRIIRLHTSVRKYEDCSNIIKNTKYSLHFRTKWQHDRKNKRLKKCSDTTCFVANAKCVGGESRFQVSCSNASPYPVQTRSVGTIAASTTCLCTAGIQQHSVVAGTIHCCCDVSCVIRPKSKLREVWGVIRPKSKIREVRGVSL